MKILFSFDSALKKYNHPVMLYREKNTITRLNLSKNHTKTHIYIQNHSSIPYDQGGISLKKGHSTHFTFAYKNYRSDSFWDAHNGNFWCCFCLCCHPIHRCLFRRLFHFEFSHFHSTLTIRTGIMKSFYCIL